MMEYLLSVCQSKIKAMYLIGFGTILFLPVERRRLHRVRPSESQEESIMRLLLMEG